MTSGACSVCFSLVCNFPPKASQPARKLPASIIKQEGMSGRQPKQSPQASRPAASSNTEKSNTILEETPQPSAYSEELPEHKVNDFLSNPEYYSSLAGYALLDLSEQLMAGLAFGVSKVWLKLVIDAEKGYFGIYWYCYTPRQKFVIHCTLAEWDVPEWNETSVTGYYDEGPNLEELKEQFDNCFRTPEVSARLLSWNTLNVHECIPVQCHDHRNGWRVILNLRDGDARQQLYERKADFERIYDVRKNRITHIHYSVDTVCSPNSCWINLEALD